MITVWLVKLILSHLLTDFVLQPHYWIVSRRQKHFASSYLYIHALLTGAVALLFIGIDYWLYAIVILLTHILIDGWKSYRPESIIYFLIDQGLHLLVLVGCWYFAFFDLNELKVSWSKLGQDEYFWIITTAFVFLSFPAGIIVGQATRKWSAQLPNNAGLVNAGKWIGILERTIILIFLLQNQYEAIGLLITAKGVLRFSDKDRQEAKTEYVLIGSLISVGLAIIVGITAGYLLRE